MVGRGFSGIQLPLKPSQNIEKTFSRKDWGED